MTIVEFDSPLEAFFEPEDDYVPAGASYTCHRCGALSRPGYHDCDAFLRERARICRRHGAGDLRTNAGELEARLRRGLWWHAQS